MNSFTVFWGETEFDIGGFIKKHPAGEDIILPYRGKDIRGVFEDVGHSTHAKGILENLISESVEVREVGGLDFVKRKLFTQEDRYNAHKIFGFLSLLSFCYRYLYMWPLFGNLGFGNWGVVNIGSLLVHLGLSITSLVFHVLKRRNVREPLIIYEEYRLHAILFTLRSVGISLITNPLTRCLFVLAIHLYVDIVTDYYGELGVTAVRNDNRGRTWFLTPMRRVYSYYQFVAIASHLTASPQIPDMGFNTIIAIQSSAFLMTLRRKNLIIWQSHILWYMTALLLSMGYVYQVHGAWIFLVSLACFCLRMYGFSKYAIWPVFAILFA